MTEATRKITIEPVTRVEGHGKVTILLDEQGQVIQARLHIVEFRGFERFVQGRPYWEVPVLVQRLCGICPVSHHLAAAKAMDGIVGADPLTPTAEKVRRLMHHAQIFQSHALHFFHLASPDLLFGFDADPAERNVAGAARRFPELALQGVRMRRFGQEIIQATAGKKIHGTGAVPGGVNKSLAVEDRDRFLREIEPMLAWCRSALRLARSYTEEHLAELTEFGSFPSNYLALVRADGALDLYDGKLRAVDAEGRALFDHVCCHKYLHHLSEEVKPWSYMKFPFITRLGPESGWYRVGPLARVNACDAIGTPEAEAARQDFKAFARGKPNPLTMAYHWARMIELLHAGERIRELLHDADLQGKDLMAAGPRREEAVGVIEAPRGTLIHHYRVDRHDQVTMANLIVSTTHNNTPMNRAVTQVAKRFLTGVTVTEGLLNRVEVAIRAYDPCLSCATHALGRMPLVVELRDAGGRLIDRKASE